MAKSATSTSTLINHPAHLAFIFHFQSSDMSQTFAPPTGPPPTSAPALPRRNSNDLDIPDEAPPAYTPSAAQAGSTTVDAGPSRMDFSGPPPIPERLTNNITGVGVGYGPRVSGESAQPTGASSSSGTASNNPFGDHNRPPQHPSKTDSSSSFAPPPHPPPTRPHHTSQSSYGGGNATGSSSQPSVDTSPTDVPTPGRPLLRKGQMLVYPKNHFCSKCTRRFRRMNCVLTQQATIPVIKPTTLQIPMTL